MADSEALNAMKQFAADRADGKDHVYKRGRVKGRKAVTLGYQLDRLLWDQEAWGLGLVKDLGLLFHAVTVLEQHCGANIEGVGVAGWNECRDRWCKKSPGDDPPTSPGC
jgi:hypothetical protein